MERFDFSSSPAFICICVSGFNFSLTHSLPPLFFGVFDEAGKNFFCVAKKIFISIFLYCVFLFLFLFCTFCIIHSIYMRVKRIRRVIWWQQNLGSNIFITYFSIYRELKSIAVLNDHGQCMLCNSQKNTTKTTTTMSSISGQLRW